MKRRREWRRINEQHSMDTHGVFLFAAIYFDNVVFFTDILLLMWSTIQHKYRSPYYFGKASRIEMFAPVYYNNEANV